jgi:hypothetical protein
MVTHVPMYRGVIRNNAVVFDESIELPDGMEFEVRLLVPDVPAPGEATEAECERAFLRYLLATGVIERIPSRLPDPPDLDRTLLEVEGPPVSETIIEERR